MNNYNKKFPYPPFPEQRQSWPGLQSRMSPKPDCGETSYVGSGRLSGINAFVTGGDSGIGRAVVIAFSREGATVVFNHLPQESSDAREVMDLLASENRNAFSVPGDIRSEDFCVDCINTVRRVLPGGRINVFVNCAGRQNYEPDITTTASEDFDDVFKTNVYALFWMCREVLKGMRAGDNIITTVSGQAKDPSTFLVDYAASKGAVATFTKGLARQVASRGIRVNGVAPGPVWTPLPVAGGYGHVSDYGAEAPLKRPAQPVEVAPLFVELATATYVSGSIWGVDGGKGQT